jgi:Bacterial EndoU nuclease
VRATPAVAALLLAVGGPAAAQVPIEGELRAASACPAYVGFRNRTNPDGARIEPGGTYRVVGLNKEGGEWVRVVVPGASPAERWVERACGALAGADDEAAAVRPVGRRFRPFFDTRDGPDRPDTTPPPPPLDVFDRAVLEVCGGWGSRPRRAAFRAMLDRPELAADVAAVRERLGERGGRPEAFKDALAELWFAADGFAHVFCGEPDGREVGGLHYRGRYLQLQELDLAGPLTPAECLTTEVEPPVYTLGIRFLTPDGEDVREDCPKGYAYDLGARDLLAEATGAWLASRGRSGRQCLAEVGEGRGRYLAALVRDREGGAIRTFYPDATPSCDGGGPASRCLCGS